MGYLDLTDIPMENESKERKPQRPRREDIEAKRAKVREKLAPFQNMKYEIGNVNPKTKENLDNEKEKNIQ